MPNVRLKNIFTNIGFWIFLLFLIRLVGITNAPLETGHNWRQSLTNMISRNFLEDGVDLLRPQIDMAGEKTGIIGSEFPFFNFLIYLTSYVFGPAHWYGRLINLIISSFGLYYFYKLITSLLNKEVAFNATLILATSIWFAFSRKIMPDTLSVSFLIIGFYYGYEFLKSGKKYALLLFFLLSALGLLVKIPALSLFSVVGVVVFLTKIPIKRRISLAVAALGSFIIMLWWYFLWVPYLLKTYQYQLYDSKGLIQGVLEIIPYLPQLLEKFYFSALHSFVAFICFCIGLVYFVKNKQKAWLFSLGIISVVFAVFIVKTGAIFPTHNYYIIPFVPVMALLAGYFISTIPAKMQVVVLCLIALEGIANQQHDFFINKNQLYKLGLEEKTSELIPQNKLIVINGGSSPQDMYFAHCKGWSVTNDELTNSTFVDSLVSLGARYLIVDKNYLESDFDRSGKIFSDENYAFFLLDTQNETHNLKK